MNVMARQPGQSISNTAAFVGCSWSAVVSISQKCYKVGTVVKQLRGHMVQGSLIHVGSEGWSV